MLVKAIELVGDVRVSTGRRQGIPTIEVTIGDYKTPWEIEEAWNKVERAMEGFRPERTVVLLDEKTPDGKFRRFQVHSTELKTI